MRRGFAPHFRHLDDLFAPQNLTMSTILFRSCWVPFRSPTFSACRRSFCPPNWPNLSFYSDLVGSRFELRATHPYWFWPGVPPPGGCSLPGPFFANSLYQLTTSWHGPTFRLLVLYDPKIPPTKSSDAKHWYFFLFHLNKLLNKQPSCRWFHVTSLGCMCDLFSCVCPGNVLEPGASEGRDEAPGAEWGPEPQQSPGTDYSAGSARQGRTAFRWESTHYHETPGTVSI